MYPNSLPELRSLKEKLFQAELLFKRHATLLKQRDELDSTITKLESEHARQHLESAEKMKRQLNECKKKRRDIDLLLDESEDLNESEIEIMREALLNLSFQSDPIQGQEQEKKWISLKILRRQEKDLVKVKEVCEKIRTILDTTIRTRQGLRGRGILSYIFGVSPNAIIAQQFLNGQRIAAASLPFLSHLSDEPGNPSKELFQKIFLLINSLEKQFKAPWGFHHIDHVFTDALGKLKIYMDCLQTDSDLYENRIQTLEIEMHRWLDRF